MNTGEIMKPHIKLRALLPIAFLVIGSFLFQFPVRGYSTFQITADPHNQYNPAIYEDIVVWEDDRNGTWDIYGYNLSTKEEFPICTDPHDQSNPAIYGDIIVWEDEKGEDWDICGYNLSTQKEFAVTHDPYYQSNPAIYGDIIVWEDRRNFNVGIWGNTDIYGYDLSTGQEFQITTDTEDQYSPAIYNDVVIWLDKRNFIPDIYGYNLSTQKEFQITNECPSCWPYPVVSKDIIVWGVTYYDTRVIDGYNLSESKRFRMVRDFVWHCEPESVKGTRLAVYEDIVVWVDYENCNRDIHGYNLSTHQKFRIVFGRYGQYSPAIYGDIVVWIDDRDGKTDIYGYDLSSGFSPLFFNYRMKVILLWVSCGILAALPTVGSVCIRGYVKRITSKRMVLSEPPRDFRRSTNSSILLVILAVLSFLYGLYHILYDIDGVLFMRGLASLVFGLFWIIVSGLFVYCAFWLKTTPLIRMTDDEIVIFRSRTSKEVIKRRSIQTIDFKDDTVALVSSSDRRVTIPLDQVDKRDKEDLIQALNVLLRDISGTAA